MNITSRFTKSIIGAAIAAALISPAIASAQDVSYAGGNEQIQGTIASIDGSWNIEVNDSNGYTDDVALHQGTIINPTGLTLEPGMNVSISGYGDGDSFDAMEIDTPYQYQGPAPTAVYYGSGAWYPGYAEGWGPSFSLVFDIGSHRYEQRAFNFGGQVRRAVTPPSGWQNRPHGYIGNAGRPQQRDSAPRTAYVPPQQQQRNFAPQQQQQRTFAPQQQQQRTFAPRQEQQRNAAPQQQPRTFAPQQQPQRTFAPQPQQQRAAAPPQQQRNFAPMQQRNAAPAARAAAPERRSGDNGEHRRN
jgi:hypothetical protein